MTRETPSQKPEPAPPDATVNAPSVSVSGGPQRELPNQRSGWPAGTLSKPYFAPQGDESRDPPADAPTPPGVAMVPPEDAPAEPPPRDKR